MRTLSLIEVEQVSGAGIIDDVTSVLGKGGTPNRNIKYPGPWVLYRSDNIDKPDPLGPTCKPPVPVPGKAICWYSPAFGQFLDSLHN